MCGASLLRERSSVWQSLCPGTPPEAIRETPASLQQGSLLGFRPGWDYRPPQQGPAFLSNSLVSMTSRSSYKLHEYQDVRDLVADEQGQVIFLRLSEPSVFCCDDLLCGGNLYPAPRESLQ